jgi:hypothetical protein
VSRAVDLDGGCEEIKRSAILNNCGNNIIKVQESTKLNKERGAISSYYSNRCIVVRPERNVQWNGERNAAQGPEPGAPADSALFSKVVNNNQDSIYKLTLI